MSKLLFELFRNIDISLLLLVIWQHGNRWRQFLSSAVLSIGRLQRDLLGNSYSLWATFLAIKVAQNIAQVVYVTYFYHEISIDMLFTQWK